MGVWKANGVEAAEPEEAGELKAAANPVANGAGHPHRCLAQPPCLRPCCGKTRQSKRPLSIITVHSRNKGNLVSSLFIEIVFED